MKICILTQPLHINYGGLLQAYALQKYLRDQGNNVFTADIPFKKIPLKKIVRRILSLTIRKYILNRNVGPIFLPNKSKKALQARHTDEFIQEYICRTDKLKSVSDIRSLDKYKFDAFVVGSDQVWRPAYSPGILTYFLNFLSDNLKVKKISYAASFGLDHCDEFSNGELAQIPNLLSKFNAISVRECSGVELCKSKFGINVEQVIDPTLLLTSEDYIKLVKVKGIAKNNGDIFVYVLDKSEDKQKVISNIVNKKELKPFSIMMDLTEGVYPPVESWISGFMDAKFIVTDSFHGVAFSLLFNKPFVAIGNKSRGLARFQSILNKFDLTDRLVYSLEDVKDELINKEIDFTKVNEILRKEREKAKLYLELGLGTVN